MNVAGATTLSAGAAYGPLLMNSDPDVLDRSLRNYLLDIQPGYYDDPADCGLQSRMVAWRRGADLARPPGDARQAC